MSKQLNPLQQPWLADFSDTVRIFVVIVVAEMMVLVYSLSFFSFNFNFLNQLALLSLLAQLIAISVVVLLTALRDFFNRFSVYIGLSLVMVMTLLVAAAYTLLLAWIDEALMFDLIDRSFMTTFKITLATGLTLLALMRYFYVQEQWLFQVEAVAKAQMSELQARIKPHFLYNSLNSIASLIPLDPVAAEKAVLNLSGLFRKAFSNPEKNMTALRRELEWVDEYLAIEQLRLMDRLSYEIVVNDALLTKKIPLLSIQPLVENAVIHGIQHLSEGGQIKVQITHEKDQFQVRVTNPYKAEKVTPGLQTGIDNIRQRLKLAFGDKAQMTVHAGELFEAIWTVKT
ncbi:histidine kinase [Marinicella sp. S1101]|uniref:sensor histidine kinase n=1 Tax=Marinicella marina TaxID=2996016 RepID=UPI002260B0EC|nr:histidine kinase [Marinicella marina]MCX7552775.1 histidine kinase [Marinicella marina]MDJ1139916.1 histidine kinase [Marinicella marina]